MGKSSQSVRTLAKENILVQVKNGDVVINHAAHVTTANIKASNGVVHIINGVLMPPSMTKKTGPTQSIVELASGNKDLSTLVAALTAGKLVTALEGKGPFTVFAPINEAFAKIPKAELEKLLDPKNIKTLDSILEYHVVAGAAVHAKDLKPENKFKTLQGEELLVEVRDGHVYVNRESHVTAADNDATNGVVHIIDRVLIPKPPSPPPAPPAPAPTKDIVALAESVKVLSTLVSALKAGKLVTTLQGKGPFTVFAPTNEAFAHLNPAVLKWLLEPEHIKELDAVLTYHVVAGAAVFSKDLKEDQEFKTVEGREIEVKKYGSHVSINHYAHVTSADNAATNGVVHVIDRVLEFHAPLAMQ